MSGEPRLARMAGRSSASSSTTAAWVKAGVSAKTANNPAAPSGTVAFFAPRAGLFVDLAPSQGLKASLGAHYALPGTMTFYRESGSQLKRYDTGGAPGASLRLGWSF